MMEWGGAVRGQCKVVRKLLTGPNFFEAAGSLW